MCPVIMHPGEALNIGVLGGSISLGSDARGESGTYAALFTVYPDSQNWVKIEGFNRTAGWDLGKP